MIKNWASLKLALELAYMIWTHTSTLIPQETITFSTVLQSYSQWVWGGCWWVSGWIAHSGDSLPHKGPSLPVDVLTVQSWAGGGSKPLLNYWPLSMIWGCSYWITVIPYHAPFRTLFSKHITFHFKLLWWRYNDRPQPRLALFCSAAGLLGVITPAISKT